MVRWSFRCFSPSRVQVVRDATQATPLAGLVAAKSVKPMKRRWAAAREQLPVRSSPTFHGTPRDGGQGLSGCFAGIARYAEGRWLPTSREAPYRLEHSLWRQMNVLRMPGNSNHHWGLCTDVALGPSGPAALYGPTKLSGRARNVARQQ